MCIRDSLQATLGSPQDWLVEWKYDGMRAQVVKRDGQVWILSLIHISEPTRPY